MRIILENEELYNLVKSYILSKWEGEMKVIGIGVIDSEKMLHDLNNCQVQIIVKEKE